MLLAYSMAVVGAELVCAVAENVLMSTSYVVVKNAPESVV